MEGREMRRIIDIRNFETKDDPYGKLYVEGYATTFNQPYRMLDDIDIVIDEQMDRHAFDNVDMSDVIMQYDHEGPVFARTRNKTLVITIDPHGLKIRAYLGGTENGRKLYEEIKGGYIDRMSLAFRVGKDIRERGKTSDGRPRILRTITKIQRFYDVSAVSRPANEGTIIYVPTRNDIRKEIIKESIKLTYSSF